MLLSLLAVRTIYRSMPADWQAGCLALSVLVAGVMGEDDDDGAYLFAADLLSIGTPAERSTLLRECAARIAKQVVTGR